MLSNSCKYGIRAVIFIALKQDELGKVGLKMIGDELKMPQPYLAKILQILTKKKLLHSSKGPHGGFSLLKPASSMTLMDIIAAVDGGDFFDSCYVTGKKCNFEEPDKGFCFLHNSLRKEKVHLTRFFNSKTIDNLIKQMRRSPSLNI